jgi:hypothetical protein
MVVHGGSESQDPRILIETCVILNAVHPDVLFDSQEIRVIQSNTLF